MSEESKKNTSFFNNTGSVPIRWNTPPPPPEPPKVKLPILRLEIDLNELLREQEEEMKTEKEE